MSNKIQVTYENNYGWLSLNFKGGSASINKDNIKEVIELLNMANDEFELGINLKEINTKRNDVVLFEELPDNKKYNMKKLESFFMESKSKDDLYKEGGWIHFYGKEKEDSYTMVVSEQKRDRENLYLKLDLLEKYEGDKYFDCRRKKETIELNFDIKEIKEINESGCEYSSSIEIVKTNGSKLKFTYEDYSD